MVKIGPLSYDTETDHWRFVLFVLFFALLGVGVVHLCGPVPEAQRPGRVHPATDAVTKEVMDAERVRVLGVIYKTKEDTSSKR